MNCATCGTALAEGGTCTVCDPWQTPEPGAQAQPVGAPAADPAALKRHAVIIKKFPAERVDIESEVRKSATLAKVTVAAFAVSAVINLALTLFPSVDLQLAALLMILPFIAIGLAGRRITRNGGWVGAAVSNLKLRPDIGLLWLFTLPGYRRMVKFTFVYIGIVALFLVVRFSTLSSTPMSVKTWLYIQAVFLLSMGAAQVVGFWVFTLPVARAVQARIAEPARAKAPTAPPVQQTMGGAEALS